GHLVIIGGGYIACELGQVFRRFGSQVTVIQRAAHLCAGEEPAVSTVLEEAFQEEEIVVWLQHHPIAVEPVSGGVRIVAEEPGGKRQTVEGTHLLIAAGRRPNTDMLQLDAAGIETDQRGFVRVTDLLETTAPGVWAIGDVNGAQPFTRVCQEEGKVAYANAFQGARLRINRRALGHAIFTDPEIGSVGYVEHEVPEPFEATAVIVTFDQVARAELSGERRGIIKVVADRKTHLLLGCHIIGPQAAELVHDAALIIHKEGRVDDLARTVGIFPTLQEAVEGTARALLRTLDPAAARAPLAVGWH
ncbi:MAG: FAD-dependent oxidoreductase, partial [bacterium]